MKQLAKLYLDEDVSVVLGKILAGRGFDVLTARDAGMLRKSDEEQLIFATRTVVWSSLTTGGISKNCT